MLNRFPDHYPAWSEILADIGRPAPDQVARAFRVPLDLAEDWQASGHAPHVVCLATWWLTGAGREAHHSEVERYAQLAHQSAAAWRRECEALRAELARVLAAGDFGSANAPTMLDLPAFVPRAARPRLVWAGVGTA